MSRRNADSYSDTNTNAYSDSYSDAYPDADPRWRVAEQHARTAGDSNRRQPRRCLDSCR